MTRKKNKSTKRTVKRAQRFGMNVDFDFGICWTSWVSLCDNENSKLKNSYASIRLTIRAVNFQMNIHSIVYLHTLIKYTKYTSNLANSNEKKSVHFLYLADGTVNMLLHRSTHQLNHSCTEFLSMTENYETLKNPKMSFEFLCAFVYICFFSIVKYLILCKRTFSKKLLTGTKSW